LIHRCLRRWRAQLRRLQSSHVAGDGPTRSERATAAQARAQAEAAARGHVEAELAATRSYVERLEHLVQEYRRARFGPRSEKLHPDQLALALEDLETAVAETETAAGRSSPEAERAVRRAKPPRTPRALP